MSANIESPVTSFDTIVFSQAPDIKPAKADESGIAIDGISKKKTVFPWWVLLTAGAAIAAAS